MKILDPIILYTFNDNYDLMYKENAEKINEYYNQYLVDIRSVFNERLYSLYIKNNQFHDWLIDEIRYIVPSSRYKGSRKDKITLVLIDYCGTQEVEISFSDIVNFVINTENTMGLDLCFYGLSQIGNILLCEIGVDGSSSFMNIFTERGTTIDISFRSAQIKLRKFR